MFLVDTNVFLEILLHQDKKETCKRFLKQNAGALNISDFSLHSIGVILFRNKKEKSFVKFTSDIFPRINILTLPKSEYTQCANTRKKIALDFDDSYQYTLCKCFNLTLVTMDQDFRIIKDIEIKFL